ncbi:response regulator [Silvanigrella paludirubra]|uniref:histidine kinase n=1 Tax=Silvanigrella paludirubra TaxID=2499159 RepID=A0A6N6VQ77_9BACT|nr:hybrid sensor histidine kinase/response regulator [Silvanigrella paludirubra]KAB8037560.1 response regulator [Silvanigrella paludirubra]
MIENHSLKEYILNQSNKQIRYYTCIIFFILAAFSIISFYSLYIKSSYNIINSLSYGIANSILLGDFFAIQKEFSSLIEIEAFEQIIIRTNPKFSQIGEYDILNIGLNIIENENSERIFSLILSENNLYYYNYVNIITVNKRDIGRIYFVKKIDISLIFSAYLIFFLLLIFCYFYLKYKINLIYKKISNPIFDIEKYVSGKININKGNFEFEEYKSLYNKIFSYKQEIELLKKDQLLITELKAISSTLQMLAHDVRQPFSRLKMSLDILKKSKSYDEMIKLIQTISINTNRDILQVEYFLNDILHTKSDNNLKIEEESLLKILSAVLKLCFEMQNDLNIELEYKFSHNYKVMVDIKKIERVFSNIILNAIQAMKLKTGKIWILTKEYIENNEKYIEICIGNSNSYIEKEDIDKIFNLFFTKGKKKGTGLGLAISLQIIKNHGGKITCNSCKQKGVEFIFTLPSKSKLFEDNKDLYIFPRHSKYFEFQYNIQSNTLYNYYNSESLKIEKQIFDEISLINKKVYNILVLDDDVDYANGILSLLDEFKLIKPFFKIHISKNFEKAANIFSHFNPDYLICDIDLNCPEHNGFDFVKYVREFNKNVKICIHTNRFIKDDFQLSTEINSDYFIVKPMNNYQFIKFISSLFLTSTENIFENPEESLIVKNDNERTVIIIDDDDFYLMLWQKTMIDIKVNLYNHPDFFYDFILQNKDYIHNIECVIFDYYIEDKVNIIETKIIENLKNLGLNCPFILCSNSKIKESETTFFDGILDKNPCEFSKIKSLFKDKFN